MDRIKIFGCNDEVRLEGEMNAFLATHPGKIVDMRVDKLYDPDRKSTCFSAMIWYQAKVVEPKAKKRR